MSFEDDKPLALQFPDIGDDEACRSVKSHLQKLLDGLTTPSETAQSLTDYIASLEFPQAFNSRTDAARHQVTSEVAFRGIDDIQTMDPYPEELINRLFEIITRLCSSFPPFHASQDLLLDLLKAFRDMPPQEVPHETPIWRRELIGPIASEWEMMKLWPFGEAEADVVRLLEAMFHDEAEKVYSYEYSDIETLSSELRIRWRNFQSFCARLSVTGLADCTYICSLRDILPSSRQYPDLEKRKMGGPNRISADAVAGAQWVVWPEHVRWLYDRCTTSGDSESDPWGIYTLEGWTGWKKQFGWIQEDERFDAKSRNVAKLARSQMETIEAENATREGK